MVKKKTKQIKISNGLSNREKIKYYSGEYQKKENAYWNKINLIRKEKLEAEKTAILTAKQSRYFFITKTDLRNIHLYYPAMKPFSVAIDINSSALILFLEKLLSELKKLRVSMDAYLTKRFDLDKKQLKLSPLTNTGVESFADFLRYTMKGLDKLEFAEFELNDCMEDIERTIKWITKFKTEFDNGNKFKTKVKNEMHMYYTAMSYKDTMKKVNSYFKKAKKCLKEMMAAEGK